MDNKNISNRVTRVIAEQLGLIGGDIKPASRLVDDLGADSLDTIEIVMAIEEEFEVAITDEEADRCNTVADIIALVSGKAVHDVVQ